MVSGLINEEQSVLTCIRPCLLILPISISLGLFLIIFVLHRTVKPTSDY